MIENNKVYTYEEAFKESKEYFNEDELAAKVFVDKYALRNREGDILENTPEKMHHRLAREFSRIEKKYPNPISEEEIFSLIDHFKYIIPQGSPMSAIGNPYHIQSSGNCFAVEPPYDSYGGIFFTDQQIGQLMKRRCGAGLSLNNLRPKGMFVKNAAKTTDGIGVFMERYSNTCREVAQNGRRGALIQLLSVHHPEIKTFITIKKDKTKVTGANISIQATDEFLKAVEKDDEFELRWPVDSKEPSISQKVSAKEIWDIFIDSSWECAEPGIFFWSTVLKNSVSNCYGEVDETFYDTSSNPCGEIIMGADSCRLLSLNLYSFVENKFTAKSIFNFKKFEIYVQKAQRIMDDMVDLEIELIKRIIRKIKSDPEPENIKLIEKETWTKILETCKKGRRTGLGITGLGDTLASLNLIYGSSKSIKVTEDIYKSLCLNAYKSTIILAKERGTFPIFSYPVEENNNFLNKIWKEDSKLFKLYKKYGRRNIALTTTPPAGSISVVAQVTSGIEPVFMVKYKRRKKINSNDKDIKVDFIDDLGDRWQEFIVNHKGFNDWMKVTGKEKVEESPYFGGTSRDIDWAASVDIQAAAQKWVCHSISKTCNLPQDATKELVEEVFLRAWKKGCKGFTIYRDGCRTGVLVTDTKQKEEGHHIVKNHAPKRPKSLPCHIHTISVKGEKYFVIVGLLNGEEPYEVFAGKKDDFTKIISGIAVKKIKRGKYAICKLGNEEEIIYDNISNYIDEEQEAVTRLISSNLRHGCGIDFIVHQLEKTKGDLMGFAKAISRVLKKYIKEGEMVKGEECPECGGGLRRAEGCVSCFSCGHSRC